MQVNNNIQDLYPAFNRSLLELESGNILNEKYNYILDILTDITVHSFAIEAVTFGRPGLVAFFGGIGTTQYTPGDYVLIRTITGTTDYGGIYKVVGVPSDNAVIIDVPYTNTVTGAEIKIYRIFRNKLPADPNGVALFNVNSYVTGRVTNNFALDNVGAFNVPDSFDRLSYLPSEEYYKNLTYQQVQNNGGLAQLIGVNNLLYIGQTVQTQSNNYLVTTYNGVYQVVDIIPNILGGYNVTLNRAFAGSSITTGEIITLPKVPRWYKDYNNISTEKIIFNGALPFPDILDFNGENYDVSSLINAPFLTTAPPNQKIKIQDRAYTQFYQSINTTATQFIVDVTDELGVLQQYIINFDCSPDNFLGLAVGPYDLNQIPAGLFDTLPARGLPVIQCNDRNYCTYLYGENVCNIIGNQTTNFTHPYINVLNPSTWITQKANSLQVEVLNLTIGGVAQIVTPTGNTYSQAVVTSQLQEEIYSNEIALQTALNIQSTLAYGSGLNSGHWLEVDQSQDFEMLVRLKLNSSFYGGGSIVEILYNWNTTTCTATYKVKNGAVKIIKELQGFDVYTISTGYYVNLPGFIGLESTLTVPTQLSEKLCFTLDYKPYAYSGVRVLFEDRLGSFIGFNFNLKRSRRIETSTDGYEKEVKTITGVDSITRGFETIQNSYTDEWEIITDYLSEDNAKYLEECFTSPTIFVQYNSQVLPAVIKPAVQRAQEKENTALRQVSITLRIGRTQYSQRN